MQLDRIAPESLVTEGIEAEDLPSFGQCLLCIFFFFFLAAFHVMPHRVLRFLDVH